MMLVALLGIVILFIGGLYLYLGVGTLVLGAVPLKRHFDFEYSPARARVCALVLLISLPVSLFGAQQAATFLAGFATSQSLDSRMSETRGLIDRLQSVHAAGKGDAGVKSQFERADMEYQVLKHQAESHRQVVAGCIFAFVCVALLVGSGRLTYGMLRGRSQRLTNSSAPITHRELSGRKTLINTGPAVRSSQLHECNQCFNWQDHPGQMGWISRQVNGEEHWFCPTCSPKQGEGAATIPATATSPLLLKEKLAGPSRVLWKSDGGSRTSMSTPTFAPDGTLLAGANGNQVFLWNMPAADTPKIIPVGGWVSRLAFSPDSETLAVVSGSSVLLLRARTGEIVLQGPSVGGEIRACVCSPSGKHLAGYIQDSGIVVLDATSGVVAQQIYASGVISLAFAPDERMLAATVEDRSRYGNTINISGSVKIYQLQDGAGRKFVESTLLLRTLAYTPDGTGLAVGDWWGGVELWDVSTQKCRWQMPSQQQHVSCPPPLAFSPDGRILFCPKGVTEVCGLDTATGRIAGIVDHHTQEVSSLAVSPCGGFVASSGWDGTFRLSPV